MAPVIKYQRWEAASYDIWAEGPTDALPSLEAEVDAWIATVNGNASNTSRQLAKVKGYLDANVGTTGNLKGFLFSAGANNNTEFGYLRWLVSNSSNAVSHVTGTNFNDDGTSNNGYGLLTTSTGGHTDSSLFIRDGQDVDFIIAYDTTDGAEFYCEGYNYANSGSYDAGFAIWKAENGEWVFESNDGTSYNVLHYWTDGSGPTGWNNGARSSSAGATSSNSVTIETWAKRTFYATSFTDFDPVAFPDGGKIVAASPYLLCNISGYLGGRVIAWTGAAGSPTNEVYKISMVNNGPFVYVDARP